MTKNDGTEVPKKPMTRDERRTLERIVKTDFETLRSGLNAQVTDAQQREIARINAEYADQEQELTNVSRELREVVEAARRMIEDKMTELRQRGFCTAPNQIVLEIRYPSIWQVQGKETALRNGRNRINQAHQHALADLTRQENDATRRVMLTSVVSEEATALLDSFPTASEVMSQALNAVDQRRAALESGDLPSPQ